MDGVPVAEEIRRAIGDLVAERRADTAFQARLRRSSEENRAIHDRLALGGLFAGEESRAGDPGLTLDDTIESIVRGGWPAQ